MKSWLYNRLFIFYTFVILLSLINHFWGQTWLDYMIGILAIPMLIVSYTGASKLFKILGTAFMFAGIFSFILQIYQYMKFRYC